MNKEEIIKKHQSICYNCINARKPAADKLRDEGYVGCAEYTITNSIDFILEAKEIVEGWVDLKSEIFGIGRGVTTNCQIMTKETSVCASFFKK
jgi:hypothetical protein